MTVKELCEKLGLEILCAGDLERGVTGGYAGDLLSWVMGRAPAGGAWVTIMGNKNVAAVALLTDVSCVVLGEGVEPDADLAVQCEKEGITLLCSGSSAFELAGRLYALLGGC